MNRSQLLPNCFGDGMLVDELIISGFVDFANLIHWSMACVSTS